MTNISPKNEADPPSSTHTALKRGHRALLLALRADELVPKLINWLSRGHFAAREEDPRQLRGWLKSLREDPSWAILGEHIDDSTLAARQKWPEIWRRALDAGFSAQSDHHHALLFGRFAAESARARDFELARFFYNEALSAWGRVLQSDYIPAWLHKAQITDESSRRQLLKPLIEPYFQQIRAALDASGFSPHKIDTPQAPHADLPLDEHSLSYAWGALKGLTNWLDALIDKPLKDGDLDENLADILRGAKTFYQQEYERLVHDILSRFGSLVDQIDLSEPSLRAILQPYNWADKIFCILPIEPNCAAQICDSVVDIGWKLRKLQLEEIESWMSRLLGISARFNDALEAFLAEGLAFGHNSTCADFLVFQGEYQKSKDSRASYFERAIAVCPGHRNASMMLSYEKLRELSDLLLRLKMIPAAITRLPATSTRVHTILEGARALLEEARALYPENDALEKYSAELEQESARLDATR